MAFVAEDVANVLAALRKAVVVMKDVVGVELAARQYAERLLARVGVATPAELRLSQPGFNLVLCCLDAAGVVVSMSPSE